MIERMYNVTVVATEKSRSNLLYDLREAGIMHIDSLVRRCERIEKVGKDISSVTMILSAIGEVKAKKKVYDQIPLDGEEFDKKHSELLGLYNESIEAEARARKLSTEIGKYSSWGDFDPEEVKRLSDDGVKLYFYTLGKKELLELTASENFKFRCKQDGSSCCS